VIGKVPPASKEAEGRRESITQGGNVFPDLRRRVLCSKGKTRRKGSLLRKNLFRWGDIFVQNIRDFVEGKEPLQLRKGLPQERIPSHRGKKGGS